MMDVFISLVLGLYIYGIISLSIQRFKDKGIDGAFMFFITTFLWPFFAVYVFVEMLIDHYKFWKMWKNNIMDSKWYKFQVLLGFKKSPFLEYLKRSKQIDEIVEFAKQKSQENPPL